jgi:hypothetical protein
VTRLLRLYPGRWRERYGAELAQLVRDLEPTTPARVLVVDLVRGAVNAHLEEVIGLPAVVRSAVKRGLIVAAVVSLGLSVEIVLSNVVFPSPSDDDTVAVVASYLSVFGALVLVGVLAARVGANPRGLMLAGLVAGLVIGFVTIATFIVVDNVWLDVVSQQPQKAQGFADSGATSMRSYINHGLIGPGVFFILVFGGLGAMLSPIGGLMFRREPGAPARATPES